MASKKSSQKSTQAKRGEQDSKVVAKETPSSFKTSIAVGVLLVVLLLIVSLSVWVASMFGNLSKPVCEVVSISDEEITTSDCGVLLLRDLPFHSIDVKEIKDFVEPGGVYQFTTKGIDFGSLKPTVVKVESVF